MSVLASEALAKSLGGRTVLRDVSLSLAGGSVVGLLGPNGAGKSTLLRLLVGLLEPDGGRVTLDGQPLSTIPDRERARRIAYLPQDGVVHWDLTVEAVVALGRIPHRGAPTIFASDPVAPADRAAIDAAMRLTDVCWRERWPASRGSCSPTSRWPDSTPRMRWTRWRGCGASPRTAPSSWWFCTTSRWRGGSATGSCFCTKGG